MTHKNRKSDTLPRSFRFGMTKPLLASTHCEIRGNCLLHLVRSGEESLRNLDSNRNMLDTGRSKLEPGRVSKDASSTSTNSPGL